MDKSVGNYTSIIIWLKSEELVLMVSKEEKQQSWGIISRLSGFFFVAWWPGAHSCVLTPKVRRKKRLSTDHFSSSSGKCGLDLKAKVCGKLSSGHNSTLKAEVFITAAFTGIWAVSRRKTHMKYQGCRSLYEGKLGTTFLFNLYFSRKSHWDKISLWRTTWHVVLNT